MDQQKIVAKLLIKLADCIEHSSAAAVQDLLDGRSNLRILNGVEDKKGVRREERVSASLKRSRPLKQLHDLADQLRGLESRDAGMELLNCADLTKKELEQLARMMDLPVLREDDAQRLRQKIIEACIGSRLNSAAIRGSA